MNGVRRAESGATFDTATAATVEEFSLVRGGPLFQVFLRARLARPQLELLSRRMVVIPALAWGPLLVLTLLEGNAIGGVGLPFLFDIETYARFLVAMPILLLAELVLHRRLRETIPQFRDRGIVPAASMARFRDAIDGVTRARDSLVPEIVILGMVMVLGPWSWRHGLGLQADTWYASVNSGALDLTAAGAWLIFISVPMFQFLLLRWYFRLAIWWIFLWKISRLPLELKAAHPDRAGGLGFLGESVQGFMPLLFAQAVLGSGFVASRVLSGARSALEFRGEIGVIIVLLLAMIVVPLLFFAPDLVKARNEGLRKYDALASTYVRDFEQKWLSGRAPMDETLIGSADIQSLADLGGSNDIVRTMWPIPLRLRTFVQLVLVAAAPFLPLVLTVIPFTELVQRVVEMLL